MKRFASERGEVENAQRVKLVGEGLLFWLGLPYILFFLHSSMKMEGQGCFKHGWSSFCFYPFWKKTGFCTWLGFGDLRDFHIKVDLYLGLGMLHNMLQVKRDDIGMDWNLGEPICKFWLIWFDWCIMTISKFWTKAKRNWPVHFAWNLGQMFLAMCLIRCKKNQVKKSYGLEMAMWWSDGLGHVSRAC